MRSVSRRTVIGMSAVAMAGLLLPKDMAFASESATQAEMEEVLDIVAKEGYLVTGNPVIDERNKEARRLWNEAVAQARLEGAEVITVVNPATENAARSSITRATKVVSTNESDFDDGSAWININYYLSAMYDVDSSNKVSNFRNHTATLTYGVYNPSIQILGYSATTVDGGRTYVIITTLSVTCYPAGVARSARWEATSYFYYTGVGKLY